MRDQLLSFYLYTSSGQNGLREVIISNYIKPLGASLAIALTLLPESALVRTSLQEAKRARHRHDHPNAAVPPPSMGRWAWPEDLPYILQNIGGVEPLCAMVWALGARTVDCVTIRPAGRFAVTAVPLLEPFPGLPEIPYSLNRGTGPHNDTEPADAILALVLLTWSLWREVRHMDPNYIPLRLLTVHRKSTTAEGAGLEWWVRACSCDRAAICLVSKDVADSLQQAAEAEGRIRPKKPKSPLLYAYLGGGVDHQPDQIS